MVLANDLLAAREQMAFTLAFHIILVPFGVALPGITVFTNWLGLRRNDEVLLDLARTWSKVMAVLFAVGAITGTVLSFELGLLWPGLFGRFGAVLGVPFAIEGLAFFTEAIFVGIYLYGWKRMSPRAHLWSGVPITIAGPLGTFAVVAANSWMNQPTGFTLAPDGTLLHVSPFAAMFNRASAYEVPHMFLASYMVAGFFVASVYAVGMLRGRRDDRHRLGLAIPFTLAAIAAPIQIGVGDYAARAVFHDQPEKFAAMELTTHTGTHQALHLGGVLVNGKIVGAIKIPDLDSMLAGVSPSTKVTGFDRIATADQPPANIVHIAFQMMVAIGFALVLLGLWFAYSWWRRRQIPANRLFLRGAASAGVASIVALEAGWITTEVGRQPWIAYHFLHTRDAVTHTGHLWLVFAAMVVLYLALGAAAIATLRNLARKRREEEGPRAPGALEDVGRDAPYGPRPSVMP